MRREMTPAEEALWADIRRDALGVRFQRQYILRGYIVDFYSTKLKLAVEVDGSSHRWSGERDALRDRWLEKNGIRIIRLSNTEVLNNLPRAVNRIKAAISAGRLSPELPPTPGSAHARQADYAPRR
jgi:very-short-patch-repair endonuclease